MVSSKNDCMFVVCRVEGRGAGVFVLLNIDALIDCLQLTSLKCRAMSFFNHCIQYVYADFKSKNKRQKDHEIHKTKFQCFYPTRHMHM